MLAPDISGFLTARMIDMRMVMLLIVLVIIGLTLTQWLGHKPPPVARETPDRAAPPVVPTRPEDLKVFEKDINRFMQDAARQRQENAP